MIFQQASEGKTVEREVKRGEVWFALLVINFQVDLVFLFTFYSGWTTIVKSRHRNQWMYLIIATSLLDWLARAFGLTVHLVL